MSRQSPGSASVVQQHGNVVSDSDYRSEDVTQQVMSLKTLKNEGHELEKITLFVYDGYSPEGYDQWAQALLHMLMQLGCTFFVDWEWETVDVDRGTVAISGSRQDPIIIADDECNAGYTFAVKTESRSHRRVRPTPRPP